MKESIVPVKRKGGEFLSEPHWRGQPRKGYLKLVKKGICLEMERTLIKKRDKETV